ncbi:MAG: FG-GAP repeat protein [Planctomycetota bacterium]
MFSKQALVFLATSLGPLAALSAQCVDEEVQKLAGGLAGDQFGIPAVDGSHALIGAPGDDTAALDGGALYAFHHDGTSWVFDQKILGSNIQIGDLLGVRIAIDGDVAIAGGSAEGTGRPGKAWIWRRAGDLWKEEARLDSPGGEADDLFGSSVAVEGDRVVVGATQATGRVTGSGAAWVYRKNGTWQVEKPSRTTTQPGDLLGYGVAIDSHDRRRRGWG